MFLTGDLSLPFQQNLSKRRLGVVVLRGGSNAIEDLLPVIPNALTAIAKIRPGQVVTVA